MQEKYLVTAREWGTVNLATSAAALGLTCRQQTGFIGALQTSWQIKTYCLLELLQPDKEKKIIY